MYFLAVFKNVLRLIFFSNPWLSKRLKKPKDILQIILQVC